MKAIACKLARAIDRAREGAGDLVLRARPAHDLLRGASHGISVRVHRPAREREREVRGPDQKPVKTWDILNRPGFTGE